VIEREVNIEFKKKLAKFLAGIENEEQNLLGLNFSKQGNHIN
jgi:hypothetical protein